MKGTLRQIVVILFGISVGILTSIGVMIYGWGLEPKSWWWIIGVYMIGHVMGQILVMLGKDDEKPKQS